MSKSTQDWQKISTKVLPLENSTFRLAAKMNLHLLPTVWPNHQHTHKNKWKLHVCICHGTTSNPFYTAKVTVWSHGYLCFLLLTSRPVSYVHKPIHPVTAPKLHMFRLAQKWAGPTKLKEWKLWHPYSGMALGFSNMLTNNQAHSS